MVRQPSVTLEEELEMWSQELVWPSIPAPHAPRGPVHLDCWSANISSCSKTLQVKAAPKWMNGDAMWLARALTSRPVVCPRFNVWIIVLSGLKTIKTHLFFSSVPHILVSKFYFLKVRPNAWQLSLGCWPRLLKMWLINSFGNFFCSTFFAGLCI